jgi:hypothetical protein
VDADVGKELAVTNSNWRALGALVISSAAIGCDGTPIDACHDGELSRGEEGIDCGGPCEACHACDVAVPERGEPSGDDTPRGTCVDGVKNQGELGVDCGGPCPACAGPDLCAGVLCRDALPCGVATCDPATGACVRAPAPDGEACDDADACTSGDRCEAGECVGEPVSCGAPGQCSSSACDPAVGCVAVPTSGGACEGEPFRWHVLAGSAFAEVVAIAADSSGAAYVFGDFDGTIDLGADPLSTDGSRDLFVAKLDAAGHALWAKRFGASGSDEHAADLVLRGDGSIALAAVARAPFSFGGPVLATSGQGDSQIALAILEGSGQHVWSASYGDEDDQFVTSLASEADGSLVIGGAMRGSIDFGGGRAIASAGDFDAFVARRGPDGAFTLARVFGDTAPQYVDRVASDGHGDVYLLGVFGGSMELDGEVLASTGIDGFLVALDPTGARRFARRFPGATGGDLATDGQKNVIVALAIPPWGADFGTGLLERGLGVAKYGPSGAPLWAESLAGSAAYVAPGAIDVDAEGRVALAGVLDGAASLGAAGAITASWGGAFVVELDPNGAPVYGHAFGNDQWVSAVRFRASGGYLVGGYSGAEGDFGPAASSYAAFVAAHSPKSDACHARSCLNGDCRAMPLVGLACDDGDLCTAGDTCHAGVCAGVAHDPCDDKNECTANRCNPWAGCQFNPVDDGTPCSAGTCQSGVCVPG